MKVGELKAFLSKLPDDMRIVRRIDRCQFQGIRIGIEMQKINPWGDIVIDIPYSKTACYDNLRVMVID